MATKGKLICRFYLTVDQYQYFRFFDSTVVASAQCYNRCLVGKLSLVQLGVLNPVVFKNVRRVCFRKRRTPGPDTFIFAEESPSHVCSLVCHPIAECKITDSWAPVIPYPLMWRAMLLFSQNRAVINQAASLNFQFCLVSCIKLLHNASQRI